MRNFNTELLLRLYEFACNRYRLAAGPSAKGRWGTAVKEIRTQLKELDFITEQCSGIQTTAR